MSNYLEDGYREFEEEYFRHADFWRAPAHALRGTFLFAVFERFTELFPDHTGEDNTVFYLTENPSRFPPSRSVVLMNSHFEHHAGEDLSNLVAFIEFASGVLNGGDTVLLDRLDAFREEIILKFCDARKEVIEVFEMFPKRSHRIDS